MARRKQSSDGTGARKEPPTPTGMAVDQRALRALFGTYWTAGGWRDASSNAVQTPRPSEAEVAYSKEAGYMFEPRVLTHDEVVAWLCRIRQTVTRKAVADAFLASLSTRRLDWRSALGSFAVARHFPDHTHSRAARSGDCPTCGHISGRKNSPPEDLSILNFERFKWGGVRHLDPVYAAFDLELFAKAEQPVPRGEDLAIMDRLLESIRGMEANARLDHLQKELGKHFDSSKSEREMLINILGYCGIMQHPDHPGFLDEFQACAARHRGGTGDWHYPVEHWRGGHGVNERAVAHWFADYEKLSR